MQAAPQPSTPVPAATDPSAPVNADNWPELIKAIGIAGMPQQLALHCVPTACSDTALQLTLADTYAHLNAPSFVGRLEQALQAHLGSSIKLQIVQGEAAALTPAQRVEQAKAERQARAEQAIFEDPLVQDFQREFDAEVQAGSIRPLDEPPEGYY